MQVMLMKHAVLAVALMALGVTAATKTHVQTEQVRMYNTAKQKLMEGKPIVGGTVYTSDPNIYCAMADAGFDFLWIEMQHSPLTYADVAKMIRACKGASAIPFIETSSHGTFFSPTKARSNFSTSAWHTSRIRR